MSVEVRAPRILLALRRSLGDAVLFLGTIQRVRTYFPNASITLLVPKDYVEIYVGQENIEAVWAYESQNFFSLVRKIRQQKFDYYFDFHSSGKNIWLVRLSGVEKSYFDIHGREKGEQYTRYPNALEWNKFFLKRILGSAPTADGEIFMPQIVLSEAEKELARQRLRSNGMTPGRVVFLGLGASRRPKRWPPEYFAHLTELLWDRYELGVVLVPGSDEAEQAFTAQIIDQLRVRGLRPQGRNNILLSSGLSVRELAALLSQCLLYIGNDSGPKHLAVATGIPTLTFFGPEDPGEWHPYPLDRHPLLFKEKLACRSQDGGRWCGLAECIVERNRCMTDLDPFMALEKIKPFLQGLNP